MPSLRKIIAHCPGERVRLDRTMTQCRAMLKGIRGQIRGSVMRPLYFTCACVTMLSVLSACASHTPIPVCPPIRDYSPEFNERLATELESMPSDSATIEAIGDYIGLRDALRQCQQ